MTIVPMIALVVSGYGIINPEVVSELTLGLLNRTLSLYFHTLLSLPVLMLLMIHVLITLKFALLRWGFRDGVLLNAFLILLGIFKTMLLIILQSKM